MIRIKISDAKLRAEIKKLSSNWLSRARATMKNNEPDDLSESPAWSDIKSVYIRAQHGKCGFCERKLSEDSNYRPKWRDFDVEHYRPKGATKAWPPKKLAKERGLKYPPDLALGEAGASGYYRLTHHHLNYLVSCKACNQAHKRDYFPVANARRLSGTTPSKLNEQEWPYLIFPLGELDTDPRELLRFDGLRPMPVVNDPDYHDHWRARITIDFFDLHSEELIRARAKVIVALGLALMLAEDGSSAKRRELGKVSAKRMIAEQAPHSYCAKTFYLLWKRSRTHTQAKAVLERADKILATRG